MNTTCHLSGINESITDFINSKGGRITEKQYDFIKKTFEINQEQRPFSVGDFPDMSQGSFRQLVQKFKPIIEVVIKSRPCQYKIKGTYMTGDSHRITKKVMGEDMFEILQSVRKQPASIHDIKIMFKSSNMHEILLKNGDKQDDKNKGIKLKIPSYHQNIIIKCIIYPKTVQIDIGCSYKPIVYDISGIVFLSSILGEIFSFLKIYSFSESDIPITNKWKITHYHFGKDGKDTFSGNRFHHTYEEVAEGMVRYYTKIMPDGKTIPRFEQIQTPQNSLDEEMQKMISCQMRN